MRAMKNMAIVCNIGHFDSEIQITALQNMKWIEVKPQVDEVEFPDGKKIIVLARGPAGQPRLRHRPSELRDVARPSPTRCWRRSSCGPRRDEYKNDVYVLPKHLDEKVAALHLDKLGVKLTKLDQRQADYIGVPVEGPFKPDHYRY